APSRADHSRRQRILAEEPTGDVHLMNALVAEVAAAGVPHPVPVIVQALPPERFHRRRTAPKVVIDFRRNRLRAVHLANAAARLVTQAARDAELAQIARVDPLDGFLDGVAGATLGSGLHNLVVFARRLDHLASLPHVVRNGLLAVNVLAGLYGPDRGE